MARGLDPSYLRQLLNESEGTQAMLVRQVQNTSDLKLTDLIRYVKDSHETLVHYLGHYFPLNITFRNREELPYRFDEKAYANKLEKSDFKNGWTYFAKTDSYYKVSKI